MALWRVLDKKWAVDYRARKRARDVVSNGANGGLNLNTVQTTKMTGRIACHFCRW